MRNDQPERIENQEQLELKLSDEEKEKVGWCDWYLHKVPMRCYRTSCKKTVPLARKNHRLIVEKCPSCNKYIRTAKQRKQQKNEKYRRDLWLEIRKTFKLSGISKFQMRESARGAFYIKPENSVVGYYEKMAERVKRRDIIVKDLLWLDTHQYRAMSSISQIVIDHNLMQVLTDPHRAILTDLNTRLCKKGVVGIYDQFAAYKERVKHLEKVTN